MVFLDPSLVRSRAAERARVEEIERQESRRIQCKAECALNPSVRKLTLWAWWKVWHHSKNTQCAAHCFWLFLFCWSSTRASRAALLQQHFKASSKQCATVLCRSPNRAGAMADSKQVAAKHQQSLQPQSQFCFYSCWSQAAGAKKQVYRNAWRPLKPKIFCFSKWCFWTLRWLGHGQQNGLV